MWGNPKRNPKYIIKFDTKEQNKQLTNFINKNELKQAMYQIENEKSPGIDGILVEFYKTFYDIVES